VVTTVFATMAAWLKTVRLRRLGEAISAFALVDRTVYRYMKKRVQNASGQ
jgi:hypothetical protein